MKKVLSLLVIIMFSFSAIYAQNKLSGFVKNADENNPLISVNIFISEIQKGTVTEDNGYYEFVNLPEGLLHVQFTYVGYKSIVKEVNITNGENTLNVNLQSSSVELSEIVVLGNSVNESDNLPYKIESISIDQLNHDGFTTLTNSLNTLPGVSQLSNGLAIAKPVVRGLYGYRLTAIVDGLKFDNQEWQNEHGFGMDDIGIGSVEIIEGPAGLLYGADAIGGVINLVDPVNAPVGTIKSRYNLTMHSNTLGARASASFKGAGKNWNWQLHAGGDSHADYLDGNDKRVANTRFAGLSAKGILGYSDDWGFSKLEYSFSHKIFGVVEPNDVDLLKGKKEDHFEREFEGPHHIVDYHIISLKNLFFAGDSKFKLNAGFQINHRIEDEGNEGKVSANNEMGELDVFRNTFSYDGEWIYSFAKDFEMTLGTQGDFKTNENEGGRILVPNGEMNEVSGFAYLKKRFERISVEGGIRYDMKKITTERMELEEFNEEMKPLDLSYNNLNGALGVVFNATENWIFKLNFATGYRAPNLAELSSNGVHEGTVRYELGNPEMESENNYQFDAGIIFQNKRLRVSLSGFYNNVKNFIYLQPTTDSLHGYKVFKFMQTDSYLFGGEATFDLRPIDWFDINASYSTVIGKKSDDSYLTFMPADKIITKLKFLAGNFSVFNNFEVEAGIRSYLEQNRVTGNELTTPGYVLLDLGISSDFYWGKQPISVSLMATNILNKLYINHLSLLRPLGLYDIGRNISLSVTVPVDFQ